MKYFVSGHQSPDTDSVISAIVFSIYLKRIRVVAEPVVVGKLNRETEFILKKFRQEKPRLLMKAPVDAKFYLVDHGGIDQAISGLKEDNIVGVVDHHRMVGLNTLEPILYRCEVVGSTSTIVAKMFREKGWRLNKKLAGLLAAGIISDTLKLRSKTTTKEDEKILKELAQIAGLDIKKFSQEMFEAKSDISGMSLSKILLSDFKEYEHKSKKLAVGIFETVDTTSFYKKSDKIFDLLGKIKKEKGLDFLFFALVDIIKKEASFYLIAEEEAEIFQKAFNLSFEEKEAIITLEGITSRKKEIVPFILKAI